MGGKISLTRAKNEVFLYQKRLEMDQKWTKIPFFGRNFFCGTYAFGEYNWEEAPQFLVPWWQTWHDGILPVPRAEPVFRMPIAHQFHFLYECSNYTTTHLRGGKKVFGGVNTDVQILWYLVIGELVLVIGVAHNALHLTITSVVGE